MSTTTSPQPKDERFIRGSEWRKWDLHFHTPSSYDYKNKAVADSVIVTTLKNAGISAVAVTDHHTIDVQRIVRLRALGADDLTVFPGIELRTELGGSEKIHIIGLFPETADLEHVWTTLQGQLGLTAALVKEKGDDKVYVDFKKASQVVRELGGLVSVHAGKKSNSIENISNAPAFKQAVKEDLANNCIDLLDIRSPQDADDYQKIVFPSLSRILPMVIGSDNHDVTHYVLKHATWVRCDPTFKGLRQLLNEPTDRIYRGDLPPILKRVTENATKYIAQVDIRKTSPSSFQEIWFNSSIPLNPGLVAIIGNKGSGKSALSDILGLLGETRHSGSFSFLNAEKFRQPRNNKARHFEAELTWASGPSAPKSLDTEIDPTAVETVKYIPQNYLETVCNELRGGGGSRFEGELKSVIFSHVAAADRLGTESLDQLIEYKTKETYSAIAILRSELVGINRDVAECESMLTPGFKKTLEAQIAEKEKELAAHDATKPIAVKEPESDPSTQAQRAELAQQVKDVENALTKLQQQRVELLAEQSTLTRRSASASKLLAKIENFRKQYQLFIADSSTEFKELGIQASEIVQVNIATELITKAEADIATRLAEIGSAFEPTEEGTLIGQITRQQAIAIEVSAKMDAPQREYQAYLGSVERWNERRTSIVGNAITPDSLAFSQARLKALDEVPARLSNALELRLTKAKEIYAAAQSLATLHRKLYKPVQDAIVQQELAKQGQFQLAFKVGIVDAGFESGLFGLISQQKKGSFCGVEEGRQVLKALIDKTDWDSEESVVEFTNEIVTRLHADYRQTKPSPIEVSDQLKKGSPAELYDFLFSFEYLKPKYNLLWGGRDLDELSPGERGTVLLLFYVLVDTSSNPLVIDQPEENLDNQTVFNALVPAIKEARKRRQIIIVTHNPNLAVVCDADQVIYAALDKKNGNTVTYESGSIENPLINRRIIDVLEGTRPAFDNRDAKYQERPPM